MARPASPTLTPHELAIMQVLWESPGLTVHEILAQLAKEPKPAYTSLLTTVRQMEKKNYLSREKEGKAHRYHAALEPNTYRQSEWSRLVQSMFGGDPVQAAVGLLQSEDLKADDIARLKAAVEDLK